MALPHQISSLSTAEKILLVEQIWEEIEEANPPINLPFTQEQQQEIERRLSLYKSGKTNLYSWEEVKKEWKNR